MKFYVYHRTLLSSKIKEPIGTLMHVSLEEKEFSPDGEVWSYRKYNRTEKTYKRLVSMLKSGGMAEDNIYPLEGRTVKDLTAYINTWGNNNG